MFAVPFRLVFFRCLQLDVLSDFGQFFCGVHLYCYILGAFTTTAAMTVEQSTATSPVTPDTMVTSAVSRATGI